MARYDGYRWLLYCLFFYCAGLVLCIPQASAYDLPGATAYDWPSGKPDVLAATLKEMFYGNTYLGLLPEEHQSYLNWTLTRFIAERNVEDRQAIALILVKQEGIVSIRKELRKFARHHGKTLCPKVDHLYAVREPFRGDRKSKQCQEFCVQGKGEMFYAEFCECTVRCKAAGEVIAGRQRGDASLPMVYFKVDEYAYFLRDMFPDSAWRRPGVKFMQMESFFRDRVFGSDDDMKVLAQRIFGSRKIVKPYQPWSKVMSDDEVRDWFIAKSKILMSTDLYVTLDPSMRMKWDSEDLFKHFLLMIFFAVCWFRASAAANGKRVLDDYLRRRPDSQRGDGERPHVVGGYFDALGLPYPRWLYSVLLTGLYELFVAVTVLVICCVWLNTHEFYVSFSIGLIVAFIAHSIPQTEEAANFVGYMAFLTAFEFATCFVEGEPAYIVYSIVFVAALIVQLITLGGANRSGLAWITVLTMVIHALFGINYMKRVFGGSQTTFGILFELVAGVLFTFWKSFSGHGTLMRSTMHAGFLVTELFYESYHYADPLFLEVVMILAMIIFAAIVLIVLYGLMSAYVVVDGEFQRSGMLIRMLYVFTVVPWLTARTFGSVLNPAQRKTFSSYLEYVITTGMWILMLTRCVDVLLIMIVLTLADALFGIAVNVRINLESEIRVVGFTPEDLKMIFSMTHRIRVPDGRGSMCEGAAFAIGKNLFTASHIGGPSKGNYLFVNQQQVKVVNDRVVASIDGVDPGKVPDSAVYLRTAENVTAPLEDKVFLRAEERKDIRELVMYDTQTRQLKMSSYIKWERENEPALSNYFYHKFQTQQGSSGTPIYGKKEGHEELYVVGIHSQGSADRDGYGVAFALPTPQEAGIASIYYPVVGIAGTVDMQARRIKRESTRACFDNPVTPNHEEYKERASVRDRTIIRNAASSSREGGNFGGTLKSRVVAPNMYQTISHPKLSVFTPIPLPKEKEFEVVTAAFEVIRSEGKVILNCPYDIDLNRPARLLKDVGLTGGKTAGLYDRLVRLLEQLRSRPIEDEGRRRVEQSWSAIGQDTHNAKQFFMDLMELLE